MVSGLPSSLSRFPFVRYSSSFPPLSSFHAVRIGGTYGRDHGVVLPRSPPVRVFVRLEESTVAHCPSLSPVSAPFLRNARHFLPFLSPSAIYRPPLAAHLSFSLAILSTCAPSLFVLYLARLARANTTFRRYPSSRPAGSLLCARVIARRKFSKHLEISQLSISVHLIRANPWVHDAPNVLPKRQIMV